LAPTWGRPGGCWPAPWWTWPRPTCCTANPCRARTRRVPTPKPTWRSRFTCWLARESATRRQEELMDIPHHFANPPASCTTRRDFLRRTGMGFGALALTGLLDRQGLLAPAAAAPPPDRGLHPLA